MENVTTVTEGLNVIPVITVVMQVLAGCQGTAAAIVLQATVNRGHHFLQALNPVAHVSGQALAFPLILKG